MSTIRSRRALAVCAGAFAFVLALIMASQVQARNVHARNKFRTIRFEMPPCPIKGGTVAPTKTPFQLPQRDPAGEPLSISGTVQMTDQTGSTVILLAPVVSADDTGLSFARTVKALGHATGSLTFDKGCTKTDPYGSNNCQWMWGQQITSAYQGALQEDITSGKLIVDLKSTALSLCNSPVPSAALPAPFRSPRGWTNASGTGFGLWRFRSSSITIIMIMMEMTTIGRGEGNREQGTGRQGTRERKNREQGTGNRDRGREMRVLG